MPLIRIFQYISGDTGLFELVFTPVEARHGLDALSSHVNDTVTLHITTHMLGPISPRRGFAITWMPHRPWLDTSNHHI